MIYVAIKYRYKPGLQLQEEIKPGEIPTPSRGKIGAIVLFIILMAGILFGLLLGTLNAVSFIEKPPVPEEEALVIEVTGFQWGWRFKYPNGIETVGLAYVPVGKVVIFKVTSDDVFHTFSIPALKVKIDAIPGRVNIAWAQFDFPGNYRVQCYELCGVGHAEMIGEIRAVPEDAFNLWYEANAPK